jgi:small conductance mechanosensitive channel
MEMLMPLLVKWGTRIGVALLIFAGGWMVVKLIVGSVCKVMRKRGTDEMLTRFTASVSKALLMVAVIIMALSALGVDTTSLIAVLGAGSLAIGLALQDSLKNLASGIMVILTHPFQVEDFVEIAGVSGKVERVDLTQTVLRTTDNRSVIVPNGTVFSSEIINYSARKTRRVDMVFGIGYGDDIALAKSIIHEILAADSRILKDPEPDVAVSELADSSVNFIVRPWVDTDDYWDVKFDVTEKIKLAFDLRGVSIPFPQMDVHLERIA